MLIYNIDISQTASSGAWSVNTLKIDNGLLKQIIIEAATDTTTFDFTITDRTGLTVFTTETKPTGKLRRELEIPLKGIHTLAVSNASTDEAFTGKLLVQEC